jgi:hypothetical protein
LQGLRQLGWTDGLNVRIETRWAAGRCAKLASAPTSRLATLPDASETLRNGLAGVGSTLIPNKLKMISIKLESHLHH